MNRPTRNPMNHNQTLYYDTSYKGFPLWSQHAPYIKEDLSGLHDTMERALNEHSRTLAVRFDLKVPVAGMPLHLEPPMEHFIRAVNRRIKAKYDRERLLKGSAHHCTVRYARKAEQNIQSPYEHYHVVLFVNNDVFRQVGNLGPGDNSELGKIIRDAWYSTGGVNAGPTEYLIHGSTPSYRRLKGPFNSFSQETREAFRHYSYLCKESTTLYQRGRPAFTTSRK
ncbi:uncharacterized protein DUF3296 [Idiomarina loihiensis]|uniref:YagK/YfjJ domain-containing protein n=1 Tax=Idiomarina TaxID=135575 RepID=UPI000D828615|nr:MULTISPECIES: inovirus-type Gp2 protein [Idiomarina]MDV6316237.1 inovirus-type Gp2 protein [Idiomarina sp. HP20-50]PWW33897.1 uncharacterized protein DUF3296 [Idiomarina loihiensis]TDP44165.1 uncharacterized protein DUF3296 [Idiomarina loihiensis]TDS20542.1 uncharacterized protein DUF3296 [Idiomarina sp. H2]